MAAPISEATRARVIAEAKEKILAEAQTEAEAMIEAARAEERAKMQAEIRAEVMSQLATQPAALEQPTYSGPKPGTWEFWATSPQHTPSVRTSGGEGFLRFQQGRIVVDNEADANLIRTQLRGMVWESNLPPGYAPPKCRITGFSPRNFEAWQAYQDWITPRIPVGYDGFSG